MPATEFRLPNALVGKTYSVHLEALLSEKASSIKGLEGTGLAFDAEQQTIEGMPVQAGDFSLQLHLQPEAQASPLETMLIINPDPRALWVALTPPEDAPFPKADTDTIALRAGGYPVLGASKRGRAHAREGGFREDDMAAWASPSGRWQVLVVSDGAGSAKLSREGSRIACEASIAHLSACDFAALEGLLPHSEPDSPAFMAQLYPILCGAAFHAHKTIRANAPQLRDYACTLSILLHGEFSEGHFFAGFGIGDSPVVLLRDEPIVLHAPEEGEFSGQTWFLTQTELFQDASALMRRIKAVSVPDFKAAFAMSDGVYDPWFETRNNLAQIVRWDALRTDWAAQGFHLDASADAETLLRWLDFWSVGNHDDRTIMMILGQ